MLCQLCGTTMLPEVQFIVYVLIVLALVGGVIALSTGVTMWAWNVFMPHIVGLPEISFVQALGLNVLLGAVGTVIGRVRGNE